MSSLIMKKLLNEIRERQVRKWLAIYLSTAITLIGLTHLLSLRYNLPAYIFDTLLIFIITGFISVFVISWNHGKEGREKIRLWEYFFHSAAIILAVLISYFHANKSPLKMLPLNSRTVAVLPFTNMSDLKEDEYFSDGITEDILTQLSKIAELKVISRTTVMKYKETELSITEIGRELGAGSILEGSIRRSGDKVRISAQLINASKDEHLWAETFDRKIDDIFDVQSEIAKTIAGKLEAELAPKEILMIESKPTNDIEAYAFYLKGREAASRYSDEQNELGITFYKKALLIDSSYALAYAGLASSYDQKVRRYFYGEEWRDSAIAMSKKALILDPDLAEGHSSLAKSYEANGEYSLAKYHYEESIRLNPNYYAAIYNLGVVYFNEESLDKAYRLINKSIQLQPDNIFGYLVLGGISQKIGCNDLALSWFKKGLELEPNNILIHYYLSDHYLLLNNSEKAKIHIDQIYQIEEKWPFGLLQEAKLSILKKNYFEAINLYEDYFISTMTEKDYEYAYALKQSGGLEEADSILERQMDYYLSQLESTPDQSFSSEFHLANINAILNNRNEAFSRLEKSVKSGFVNYQKFLISPFWDSLRTEFRFHENIEMMKNKIDSMMIIIKGEESDWIECY